MSDNSILRKLTIADVPGAMALSTEAGWNQTADDWRMLIELSPQGCLAIEIDGEIASTATLTCYGTSLAWVGMVLTRIKHRGRGYAMRLLKETLRVADEMGVASVKLDATDLGQPLYEKLGFRAEQPVERWWRAGHENASTKSAREPVGPNWQAADVHAFGVDRRALLEKLSRRNAPLTIEQLLSADASGPRNFVSRAVGLREPTNRAEIDGARFAKSEPGRLVLGSDGR